MRKFTSGRKETKARDKAMGTEMGIGEFRVRLPNKNEIFGKVEQLHGGKRMMVKCADGNMRMCRVPGRLKKIWIKNEDYVLIEPLPAEGDKKGEITWRYRGNEVEWLQRKGYAQGL